jgi:hypothetical protein
VEESETASLQGAVKIKVQVQVRSYRQSVRLGVKPLEPHDQRIFFELNACSNSPYVTSSLTKRWVSGQNGTYSSLYILGTDNTENSASSRLSSVAHVSAAAVT